MKNIKSVWLISLALSLSGCGRIMIGNHEFCGDVGPLGAVCFKTLSDEKREIPKEQWDAERFGMICGKADAFADLKGNLLKLCRMTRKCWYSQARVEIERFGGEIEAIRARSEYESLEVPLETDTLIYSPAH